MAHGDGGVRAVDDVSVVAVGCFGVRDDREILPSLFQERRRAVADPGPGRLHAGAPRDVLRHGPRPGAASADRQGPDDLPPAHDGRRPPAVDDRPRQGRRRTLDDRPRLRRPYRPGQLYLSPRREHFNGLRASRYAGAMEVRRVHRLLRLVRIGPHRRRHRRRLFLRHHLRRHGRLATRRRRRRPFSRPRRPSQGTRPPPVCR
mmetsp:Transcript_16364/g.53275  ORF Transcript_16364/g.53275 Transcript_16364/m.53275 type:complete len:203 (+) Transcript_16364:3103-3711(+)